jgi:hypothetical protein
VHQHQLVGVLAGRGEVVQRGQHRQSAAGTQVVNQLEHLLLMTDVQRRGRLVEQQHGRLLGQCPGEHGALALTTGQAGQPALGEHGQLQAVHGTPRRVPVVAAGAAEITEVRRAAEQHVLADRHVRREHRFLRHIGDQPGPAGD